MKPKLILRVALICGFVLALAVTVAAQEERPFLMEAGSRATLPQGFRSCSAPLPETADAPSGQGLSDLAASASAQFSQAELRAMRRRLPLWLVVVDLRSSPHGYINGLAVSWDATPPPADDAVDLPAWLEREETERLQTIQEAGKAAMIAPAPPGGSAPPALEVRVLSAQSEAQLMALSGLGYFRLPLSDSPRPSDREVEDFLGLLQGLPPGTWLHFHGGLQPDRAALMLLMLDILANARELGLAELVTRQVMLGGGVSLLPHPQSLGQEQVRGSLAHFLNRFHDFARQTTSGKPGSWLAWLREQAPAEPAASAQP